MLSPLQSRGLVNEDPDPLSFSELRHGLLNKQWIVQSGKAELMKETGYLKECTGIKDSAQGKQVLGNLLSMGFERNNILALTSMYSTNGQWN